MPCPRDEVTAITDDGRGAHRPSWHLIVCLLASVLMLLLPTAAQASNGFQAHTGPNRPAPALLATTTGATSLESAAAKAGETGRNVAMSLIGLALAVAAIVLAFKRDFREAAAVFAVGIVCVLLASPAGESLLRETVNAIVGS